MKKVLIPTDFSKNADHAIDYALNLYKCERTNFYFVHAYADEAYKIGETKSRSDLENRKTSLQKQSDSALQQLLERIGSPLPNPKHRYEVISAFSSLIDAINDIVEEQNIDVIIMGTKGASMDHKKPFGSNTVQVFKYVKCPVLAVPEQYEYHQPKYILFTTDYQLPYKRRELKLLDEIAGSFKSEIHCLYFTAFKTLSHRQMDNKLFLENSLSKAYLFFEHENSNDVIEGISNYRKNHKVDLLVMVKSRNSFLEDWLYRTTVDKMGLKTDIPFLVMQNVTR